MSMQHPRNLAEWQKAVERSLRAGKNGVQIAIAHGTDEAQTVRDEVDGYKNLTPTAPVELNFQTSTYINENGKRRGRVIVDFPDVILSTNAQALTVNNYELSGQDQGQNPLDPWRTVATSDISSLMAMDFTPGAVWKFKARALSGNFTNPGQWSAETSVTITSDTTPPPQTSTPVVTISLATMKVTWDGLAAGGGAMPADLAKVEVAFGLTSSPTTIIETLYEAGFVMVPKSAYNVAHYFRFRAIDTSGNIGPWSAQATAIPTPLVDIDVIIAHLDAATTEIVNIGAASILNGAINSAKLADNAVSQAKLQDQIISLGKMDTTANNKIQQGIDDAFTAQTKANTAFTNAGTALTNAATADGKAVTAQTAADTARVVVDAKIAAGSNLAVNGSFDATPITSPPLGWPTRTLSVVQASTTTARSGANVLKCSPTTATAATAFTDWMASGTGRTYYVEYWVRADQAIIAANNNLELGTYLSTLSTAGATVNTPVFGSSAVGTLYPKVLLSALSTTTWTKFSQVVTVAASDIVSVRGGVRIPNLVTAGNTFEIDSFRFIDMTEAKAALDAAATAQAQADLAFTNAGSANSAAGLAQTSADGKNNIMYMAAKPSTTAWADGDTVFIRTAPGAPITEQWKWVKTGPTTGSWNQETLGHQVIASVDLGKATIGELNGIYVKAFSLSADTLKIGSGTNLFPDPKMTDTAGWPVTAGITMDVVGTGKNGQGSMLIASSGTQVGAYYSNNDVGKRITVSPNSSYRLTIWVRSDQAIPVGGVSFYGRTYPIDGSGFSFTTPANVSNDITSVGGTGIIPANTWTAMTGVITTGAVPSGLIVGAFKQATAPGSVRFSDPTIEVMGVGRLIVDGTIQGNHIQADSIAAKHLTITDLTNFAPSLAESPTDYTLLGDMQIVTSGLDASGWRFNVSNGAVESRAYGPYMAVSPGENLWMGATLYRGSGTAAAYLRYYFYDSNKVVLATGAYTAVPQSSGSASGTRFEGPALVPAGAAYARWTVIIALGTASTGFYNIQGRRRLAGELIIDGTVTSDAIATNAVTAKQILVGDFQNFAIGSDFEDSAAVPWNLAVKHTLSTTQKKSGTQSLKLAGDPAVSKSGLVADFRVKEGEQYYFKFWAYIDATFDGTGNSKLRISDQTGTPSLATIPYNGIARSTWAPVETTVTVGAGVTSLTASLWSDHTVGLAYVDDIQIRRVSEASLIMNLGVEKLTATAANIDTAVIDKLYADVVRSRRMTTDMMVVGRGVNGLVDEFFEQADLKTYRNTIAGAWGGWGNNSGLGLNWYGGTITAGTSRSFYYDTVASYDKNSYIPVQPGQVYLLSAQYTSGVSGPRATMKVVKRDGTISYTTTGWAKRDATTNSYGAAGSVLTLERLYTVPADVAYVMPAVQFESTCTSAYVYGGATFTNMATASLIVDGAITARNLTVTDEMWTNIIHFKLIGGDEIDANLIVADVAKIGTLRGGILINDAVTTSVIKADAITSKHTITGATIQTIVTAARGIKLTSSSLKAYNSSGTNTYTLDATTGDVLVSTLSTSATGARVKVWDRLDGTAAVDLYTDTTGQHGSLYTQPQAGNGGYVTNIMHYTATPITANNWTTRLTLFADETWSIDQKTHAAEVTGDANGRVYVRGQFLKNNSAVTETFVVGSTVTSANATGTYVLTYFAPVTQGTRHVLATADSASVAQSATKSATASGFSWMWSTTASSNISMRYWAVWTD